MINVFAIDPEICGRLDWFRYITEHCKACLGRAIADLPPGEWSRKGLEHIDRLVADKELGPVKGQSLKRRMDRVRDRLVDRPGTVWDYMEGSWLVNTESEHRREPFQAIVSPEYEEGQANTPKFHPEDIDEAIAEWNTPNGMPTTRTNEAFADAVLPLLVVSKRAHFVDRGFNVDGNSLYTRNYRKIFNSLNTVRYEDYPEITIHCCPDADIDRSYFETSFRALYANMIPASSTVTIILWQVDDGPPDRGAHPYHNRFVITNLCGVMVGYGTDSPNHATDAPDELQIVDESIYRTRYTQCNRRDFPLVSIREEIVITGSAS